MQRRKLTARTAVAPSKLVVGKRENIAVNPVRVPSTAKLRVINWLPTLERQGLGNNIFVIDVEIKLRISAVVVITATVCLVCTSSVRYVTGPFQLPTFDGNIVLASATTW
jgi:hypothetical protein